jgi:hypothetical protein
VLPAAFLATALAAGAGGYLVHQAGTPAATAAPSAATPTGTGAGTGTGTQAGNHTLDARAVFDRLVAAGLPLTNAVPVDKSTDPDKLLGRSGGYTSRLSFSLPGGNPNADQYGIGRGGIIEVFANANDARRSADRMRKEGDSRSGERQYLAGAVLVRIAGGIDRALADKFKAPVATIDKAV